MTLSIYCWFTVAGKILALDIKLLSNGGNVLDLSGL